MSITDELLAPSGPILRFINQGDAHKITVDSITKIPVTNLDTGTPETWPNGDTKYQYVVTGPSETYVEEPGATVRLFIKGYASEALREALREAQVKDDNDVIGGELIIKWDTTDEPKRPGYNGAKRFKARFTKATPAAITGDLI